MPNDSNNAATPTLDEVVGVLLPHVEKIEEGFQAIRLTLEGLSTQFGDASLHSPSVAQSPTESSAALAPSSVDSPPADAPPVVQPPHAPIREVAVEESRPPHPGEPAGDRAVTSSPVQHQAAPTETRSIEESFLPPPAQPRPTPIAVGGGHGGNISQIIFGPQLTSLPATAGLSGELVAAMYEDDQAAIGMVGQLMEFRTATADRMAKMLKELGEAFYRWRPEGDGNSLDALIAWTHALIDEAGLKNRIEIVRNGDRYDQHRHNAKERGVEVCDVLGWVVLRDNGKVYSKANVSVK